MRLLAFFFVFLFFINYFISYFYFERVKDVKNKDTRQECMLNLKMEVTCWQKWRMDEAHPLISRRHLPFSILHIIISYAFLHVESKLRVEFSDPSLISGIKTFRKKKREKKKGKEIWITRTKVKDNSMFSPQHEDPAGVKTHSHVIIYFKRDYCYYFVFCVRR